MAGKGEKAKIPLKSCGLGEGCSVVHGVGCEGAGREPRMGLVRAGCPFCRGDRGIWTCFTPSQSEQRAWQVFLAGKVGQAETQGASELNNREPAASKLNYSGLA